MVEVRAQIRGNHGRPAQAAGAIVKQVFRGSFFLDPPTRLLPVLKVYRHRRLAVRPWATSHGPNGPPVSPIPASRRAWRMAGSSPNFLLTPVEINGGAPVPTTGFARTALSFCHGTPTAWGVNSLRPEPCTACALCICFSNFGNRRNGLEYPPNCAGGESRTFTMLARHRAEEGSAFGGRVCLR